MRTPPEIYELEAATGALISIANTSRPLGASALWESGHIRELLAASRRYAKAVNAVRRFRK